MAAGEDRTPSGSMPNDHAPEGTHGRRDWLNFKASNGAVIATATVDLDPNGCRFWHYQAPDGSNSTVLTEACTPGPAAREALAALAATGTGTYTDDWGVEAVIDFDDAGSWHICTHGTYLRVTDSDNVPVDSGSAYWTDEEVAEDPVLVWGAIFGATARTRTLR